VTSLKAESVAFAYDPGRPVFSGVTAEIRCGSIAGIVGPNGSGKSTLLRVLCGLLRPDSGSVTLDGRALTSFSRTERAKKIAFLPQSVNPAFALTVFEVVCLGRYPRIGAMAALGAEDRAIAERCLTETGTVDLRDRDFMTLSGGERQRVLIASVLAQEPDLVLLDEPTSALDIHHQMEIMSLLRRLAARNFGFAVVTHDLNLAAQFCDCLLLLASGGVAASGGYEQVLTEPVLSSAYNAAIRVDRHPSLGTPLIWARQEDRE
jgi:iron complex transport system ATP-binding protein